MDHPTTQMTSDLVIYLQMTFDILLLSPADGVAFSEMSLRQNASVLEYCRTSSAALSGATAGILGLTGLWGFLFYFIASLMLSVRKQTFDESELTLVQCLTLLFCL